jgi:chemotaxis protein methyltransferase CheR
MSVQNDIRGSGSLISPLATGLLRPAPASRAGQVHRLVLLVEARFGIQPNGQVERKLERIFERASQDELRSWVDRIANLPANDSEWLSLVESLTVHETYFCRDKPMLRMLRSEVMAVLLERKKKAGSYSFKIWSAGCSTGEETINIAALLLQALLKLGEATLGANGEILPNPRWRLEVVGTDVSRQAVSTSKNAQYGDFGMGSFRDFSEKNLKQFFEKVTDVVDPLPGVNYYRAKPFLRRWLNFRQHNLLSGMPAENNCDLVICRNVLIYFEDSVKRKVQELFLKALQPQGVLIMGGPDVQFWPEKYERRFGSGGVWYIKKD